MTGPLDEVEREFGEPVVVPLPTGAEAAPGCGPNPQLDLSFADMTGDGMQDLVRVRRGQVEYWPTLGNGRFGDRVVMDGAPAVPTSALELAYDDDPAGARLIGVTRVGFVDGARAETAPLVFAYAGAGLDETFLPATTTTGLTAARTQLVDLYGEGLPGILYQGERGWLYQANQGGGQFAAPAAVAAQPNFERGVAVADVDRDGDTELAVTTGRQAGSFALEREERRWAGFRPFAAWPKLEGAVGRTFWVDLNGDGRSDAVIARGDALVWFPSVTGPLDEVEREFGEPVVVPLPTGAEAAPGCGPNPQLDLFFADMTGDGMQDLVRVRRGQVEYWPALGNGRFGDRVVMDGAPAVPTTAAFDSARVRLVDLDGSGTADVLYLDDGRVWHFPNLGGRRLGDAARGRAPAGVRRAHRGDRRSGGRRAAGAAVVGAVADAHAGAVVPAAHAGDAAGDADRGRRRLRSAHRADLGATRRRTTCATPPWACRGRRGCRRTGRWSTRGSSSTWSAGPR
ncbi:MAG: VCBS repeat-containing protein [Myxococcales bacterium]|nr:VCBS repeat-containing protein [Myxococcales bacterium]